MSTTTTMEQTIVPQQRSTEAKLTFGHIVRSEVIKFRTLRSYWVTLGVSAMLMVGMATIIGMSTTKDMVGPGFDAAGHGMTGVLLVQLAVAVLGVLMITNEYNSGMIRNTFTAVPRRTPVLVAKALVLGSVTFVVMGVAALASFLIAQAALAPLGASVALTSGAAIQVILGTAGYLTLIAIVSMGVGALLRNTAAGVTTMVGVLFVVPIGLAFFPNVAWAADAAKFLPGPFGLGASMTTSVGASGFAFWTATAIMAGYAVAAIVISTILVKRRDA